MKDIAAKLSIACELLHFFWKGQWWWLTPLIFMLLLIGIFLIFAQSSAVAPFIYTLF